MKSKFNRLHPNWDDQDLHNDIALLKLERAVDFNNNIQPLDLPADDEYIDEDVTLTVSGFGLTSDTSDLSNNLLYVQVRSISQSNCNNYYGGGIWEGQICTLGIPNGATCEGDSGGPLVREVDGRRISVGIVSFGAAAGCAAGFPDGYSRTSYYRQWIREVSGL